MFDVGFSELAVIFVLALIVLGPERLPKVASQLGRWAGKARRMAHLLSTQFQEEMNAIDPRRIMDPPPPAATPGYSRPGVDDLKPRAEPPHEAAAAGAAREEPASPPHPAGDRDERSAQP